MPYVASSAADLLARLAGVIHIEGGRVVIDDRRLRGDGIRDIA